MQFPSNVPIDVDSIFGDLIDECIVIIYIDDIFLFAKTKESLENNTKRVLQRLQENDLFLKPNKCEFCKTRIEWLGMIIEYDKNIDGSQKAQGYRRMAQPKDHEANPGIPRIWKLLLMIYQTFL